MILWYCLKIEAQQILIAYQRKYYHKGVKIVEKPLAEIPVDYAREMAKAPGQE